MAILAECQHCYAQAEEYVEQAIPIIELLTGGEHPELADSLDLAANVMQQTGFLEKARSLAERAKAMRRHLKQVDH
jgi:hypothetical protein